MAWFPLHFHQVFQTLLALHSLSKQGHLPVLLQQVMQPDKYICPSSPCLFSFAWNSIWTAPVSSSAGRPAYITEHYCSALLLQGELRHCSDWLCRLQCNGLLGPGPLIIGVKKDNRSLEGLKCANGVEEQAEDGKSSRHRGSEQLVPSSRHRQIAASRCSQCWNCSWPAGNTGCLSYFCCVIGTKLAFCEFCVGCKLEED